MREAAHLRLDTFQERLNEIGKASKAVGRKIILAVESACHGGNTEITQPGVINSIQMPITQLLHQEKKLGRRTGRRGRVLVHLLQGWHHFVLDVTNDRRFGTLQRKDLGAVIVRVVVCVEHRERPKDPV